MESEPGSGLLFCRALGEPASAWLERAPVEICVQNPQTEQTCARAWHRFGRTRFAVIGLRRNLCRRVTPSAGGQIFQPDKFDLDFGSRSPQQIVLVFERLDTAQTTAFKLPGAKIEDVCARTGIVIWYETELYPIT